MSLLWCSQEAWRRRKQLNAFRRVRRWSGPSLYEPTLKDLSNVLLELFCWYLDVPIVFLYSRVSNTQLSPVVSEDSSNAEWLGCCAWRDCADRLPWVLTNAQPVLLEWVADMASHKKYLKSVLVGWARLNISHSQVCIPTCYTSLIYKSSRTASLAPSMSSPKRKGSKSAF